MSSDSTDPAQEDQWEPLAEDEMGAAEDDMGDWDVVDPWRREPRDEAAEEERAAEADGSGTRDTTTPKESGLRKSCSWENIVSPKHIMNTKVPKAGEIQVPSFNETKDGSSEYLIKFGENQVWRRHTDFEVLRQAVETKLPNHATDLPKLPSRYGKVAEVLSTLSLATAGRESSSDPKERRIMYEEFLTGLLSSEVVQQHCRDILLQFLEAGDLAGTMLKRSTHLGTWRERYFRLINGHLQYWPTEPRYWTEWLNPKEEWKLQGSTQVVECNETDVCDEEGVFLRLTTTGTDGESRHIWLNAGNTENRELWLRAFNKGGASIPTVGVVTLPEAFAQRDLAAVFCMLIGFIGRALKFVVQIITSTPFGPILILVLLGVCSLWTTIKQLATFVWTGNLVCVYNGYTAGYSVAYLYFNRQLILVAAAGISNIWLKDNAPIRYKQIVEQLKEHAPGVLRKYREQIVKLLVFPVIIIVSDFLLGILLLPGASLTIHDGMSVNVACFLLFVCYCMVAIDVQYLVAARAQQIALGSNSMEQIGKITKLLENGEKVLSFVNPERGLAAKFLNKVSGGALKRLVSLRVKKLLSATVSSTFSANMEKELSTYASRLVLNMVIITIFTLY